MNMFEYCMYLLGIATVAALISHGVTSLYYWWRNR